MANPKMGNNYPAAISTYPSWVAHETPYTAEWGNSVGFEFYLIEYELGESPRGSYNSVADRLDSFPDYSGFNYWARGYYMWTISNVGPGTFGVYFNIAEHDKDDVFDLVGRRKITAPVTGWYNIKWNLFIEGGSGVYPCEAYFRVKRSRGGIYQYAGKSMIVLERQGFYTLRVNETVHLEKDEYLTADLYFDQSVQMFTRGEYESSVVDFTLISTDPYDRK